jgi:hypothetical protein
LTARYVMPAKKDENSTNAETTDQQSEIGVLG